MVVSIASIMVTSEEFEAASSFNLAKLYCLHCFRVGYNLNALMNGSVCCSLLMFFEIVW